MSRECLLPDTSLPSRAISYLPAGFVGTIVYASARSQRLPIIRVPNAGSVSILSMCGNAAGSAMDDSLRETGLHYPCTVRALETCLQQLRSATWRPLWHGTSRGLMWSTPTMERFYVCNARMQGAQ